MTVKNFRLTALAEATSFLLLLIATSIKYGADQPVGVQILGPLHGALFVLYVVFAIVLAPRVGWSLKTLLLVLLGAVVPLGGFVVDRWLGRQDVAGAGRTV